MNPIENIFHSRNNRSSGIHEKESKKCHSQTKWDQSIYTHIEHSNVGFDNKRKSINQSYTHK